MKQHFEPKRLVIARRFYFYRQDQAAEENVAGYMAELQRLVAPCDFRDFLNEALRDRLVCGLRNEAQKRLLSEAELSLAKAITIAQSMEAAEVESTIYNVCQVEYLPVTFMQLQRATRHDPVLCKVLNYTKSGWPSHFTSTNKVTPEELKPF